MTTQKEWSIKHGYVRLFPVQRVLVLALVTLLTLTHAPSPVGASDAIDRTSDRQLSSGSLVADPSPGTSFPVVTRRSLAIRGVHHDRSGGGYHGPPLIPPDYKFESEEETEESSVQAKEPKPQPSPKPTPRPSSQANLKQKPQKSKAKPAPKPTPKPVKQQAVKPTATQPAATVMPKAQTAKPSKPQPTVYLVEMNDGQIYKGTMKPSGDSYIVTTMSGTLTVRTKDILRLKKVTP
jgi:outer membrane biosynthesis protein TonB